MIRSRQVSALLFFDAKSMRYLQVGRMVTIYVGGLKMWLAELTPYFRVR